MSDDSISRRRLLRALGIAGVATGTLAFVTTGQTVAYQAERTYQTDAGADLVVEWATMRNGAPLTSGATQDDTSDPVLAPANVVPGDEGVLALKVGVEDGDDSERTFALSLRAVLTDESENGRTEPERMAGDTDDAAELADHLQAEVWYDRGTLGGCDGTFDFDESVIASGTLREVTATLESGVELSPAEDEGGCFAADESVCLGVRWWLPDRGPVDDVVQTDSATVDLAFGATEC